MDMQKPEPSREEEDRLVDTHEAARLLGLKYNTMVKARIYGGGGACRYVKLGRAVRYSVRDLMQHIHANATRSTSEHWAAR